MIELTQLTRYGENNRIEAKRSQGGLPHSLWETYSSFANTIGGLILLGVSETEEKKFRSVPLKDPEALVEEFISILTDPKLIPVNILNRDQIKIAEADGNRIIMIEVPAALACQKPIYIGSLPFRGTYLRNGEGDYRCSKEEVLTMMNQRFEQLPDGRPLSTVSLESLKLSSIHQYRDRLEELYPDSRWNELDDIEFLLQVNGVYFCEDGTLHPTNAGLLMFGKAEILSTLFHGYSLIHSHHNHTTELDNCSDLYFTIEQRLHSRHPEEIAWALTEAVVNAIVHADYRQAPHIHINERKEEIRISNPGHLRSPDALPSNPVLYQMFHTIQAATGKRTGLLKIEAIWRQQGFSDPQLQYIPEDHQVVFRLPVSRRKERKMMLTKTVVDLITSHIELSYSELKKKSRISDHQLQSILNDLTDQDLICYDPESGKYHLKGYN